MAKNRKHSKILGTTTPQWHLRPVYNQILKDILSLLQRLWLECCQIPQDLRHHNLKHLLSLLRSQILQDLEHHDLKHLLLQHQDLKHHNLKHLLLLLCSQMQVIVMLHLG